MTAMIEPKNDVVYFCLACQHFTGFCNCCEPPGCSLSAENAEKLEDTYLKLFIGTVWDKIPSGRVPLNVQKRFARKSLKIILPDAQLSFEPPRCPTCEDREVQYDCSGEPGLMWNIP